MTTGSDRLQRLRVYADNLTWYVRHVSQLKHDLKYMDRYVAVHEGHVIAADVDLTNLREQILKLLDPASAQLALVQYVSSKSVPRAV